MFCKRNAGRRRLRLSVSIWIAGLSLFALSACSAVGPNFKKPEPPMPANWAGPALQTATPAEKDLASWWTIFRDPVIDSLVQRVVEANLDLKMAEARILQARAARRAAASGLGPTLDAVGSFQRSRAPGDAGGRTSNQYQAGFDAGWEIDIFGGVRRGVEAAGADLQAAVEARRDVLVTLTAEVTRDYIDLRTFQQRIAIARQNLRAQERSAELTRQRFEGGFASGLDVANARALVATTASQIPVLETSAQQMIYSISLLLGQPPGALLEELSPPSEIPAGPPSVPVGLPSELLRRRPDIRQAEAQIHGATARIGVATADLYPKFTITGSVGLQAGDFSNWLSAASRFWSFGPSVSWNLFASGLTRANIDQQKALEEQSLIAYRQTILKALQEVENALIASEKEQEHRQAVADAVSANQRAVELATKLYTEGQTDFLNVLDAQRSLYASQDTLVQSAGAVSANLIALYKALGGGWEAEADRLTDHAKNSGISIHEEQVSHANQ